MDKEADKHSNLKIKLKASPIEFRGCVTESNEGMLNNITAKNKGTLVFPVGTGGKLALSFLFAYKNYKSILILVSAKTLISYWISYLKELTNLKDSDICSYTTKTLPDELEKSRVVITTYDIAVSEGRKVNSNLYEQRKVFDCIVMDEGDYNLRHKPVFKACLTLGQDCYGKWILDVEKSDLEEVYKQLLAGEK